VNGIGRRTRDQEFTAVVRRAGGDIEVLLKPPREKTRPS
jgi:hypothetical protein